MGTKNGSGNAQILALAGGIVSIISVFLPWYSAKASMFGVASSISVNGLGSISGNGLLLGLWSENATWEFQGLGVLALGIVSIAVAVLLREKIRSMAMFICGVLIIGGWVVNIRSIWEFSGTSWTHPCNQVQVTACIWLHLQAPWLQPEDCLHGETLQNDIFSSGKQNHLNLNIIIDYLVVLE